MNAREVAMGVWLVESNTHRGVRYHVNTNRDAGVATCDCRGYEVAYRAGNTCTHIKEVADIMASREPAAARRKTSPQNGADERALVVASRPLPTQAAASLPTMDELSVMRALSEIMAEKQNPLLPAQVKDAQSMFLILYTGRELGIGPMTAARHLFITGGKVEPDTQLMLALCLANDASFQCKVINTTRERCDVEVHRGGKLVGKMSYTYDMARESRQAASKKDQAGVERNPWILYPDVMVRWACIKRALRLYAPDLINGLRADARGLPISEAESMIDDDPDGLTRPTPEIIDAEARDVTDAESRQDARSATEDPEPVSESDPPRNDEPRASDARESASARDESIDDLRLSVRATLTQAQSALGEKFKAVQDALKAEYPQAVYNDPQRGKLFVVNQLGRSELLDVRDFVSRVVQAHITAAEKETLPFDGTADDSPQSEVDPDDLPFD